MRKQISKRRWKARCRMGHWIPATAVVNHQLWKWFAFEWDWYIEHGKAQPK